MEPKKFKIIIEEHISQEFEVEAIDIEEALDIAEEKYWNEEFIVEPSMPTARLMAAESEDGKECTEWEEF